MGPPEITNPPASPPAPAPGRPRVLACPVCGGNITLRAVGHSVNAACAQCGSLLDVALEAVKVLKKAHESQRALLIPLGSRATLRGVLWEAIGYQERSSGSATEGRYVWEETLLFNPRHGFRFLARAQGHWTLYQVVKSGMALPERGRFQRFFAGAARVDYVLGEFYWRVKVGDEVHVTDSIAPPHILSVEKDGEEITAALGTWLPPEEIAAAFALAPGKMPRPQGVAPNQPSPFAQRVPAVLRAALLAALAATAIVFAQAYGAKNQVVYAEHFDVGGADRDEPLVTAPFTLEGETGNVCLESRTVLDNNWAELNATLVDETSGQRRNLIQGMEHYSGYEGGEHWSEGDPNASNCFPAVPGGQYRLILEPDAGVLHLGADRRQAFVVRVLRDTPIWSNWFTLLLALLPYPVYLWLRHHSFEYTRWSESDAMPEMYAGIRDTLSGENE